MDEYDTYPDRSRGRSWRHRWHWGRWHQFSTEETAFGWVLGFGAEYAISTNWSAFIEYDHMDFEKKTGALNLTALAGGGAPGTAIANVDFKNKVSVAKIGVNYKF